MSQMNMNDDILKIINAKRKLYDKILDKLEGEINDKKLIDTQIYDIMYGGATFDKISDEIKIIGNITLPYVSDSKKIEFRLAKAAFPRVMSLDQAQQYAELITK